MEMYGRLFDRLDATDQALIGALRAEPRASITNLARVTGLARGTVQSRLDRLVSRGVVRGFGPDLDPSGAGAPVMAFTTLSIAQGGHDELLEQLSSLEEVLDVHVITGSGDLLCRVAAASNDHLHEVLQQVVRMPGVTRADSQLALSTPVSRTLADQLLARQRRR